MSAQGTTPAECSGCGHPDHLWRGRCPEVGCEHNPRRELAPLFVVGVVPGLAGAAWLLAGTPTLLLAVAVLLLVLWLLRDRFEPVEGVLVAVVACGVRPEALAHDPITVGRLRRLREDRGRTRRTRRLAG